MFTQIQEFIPEFPLQENNINLGNFFLIKDTLQCDGNFIISSLLNFLMKKEEKVLFLGGHQNYAHYLNVSKKIGLSLEPFVVKKSLKYLDLQSEINDWIPQDLPYTEKTSNNFIQPPSVVDKATIGSDPVKAIQKIIENVQQAIKDGKKHIIIDNLTHLYNSVEKQSLVFQFFQDLYRILVNEGINLYILITCMVDQTLLKHIGLIEQQANICLEFFENPSGYQQDVAGQLIVKIKQGNAYKFLVNLTENQIKISRNYKA